MDLIEFNNIPITFMHNEASIYGIICGSLTHWIFYSNDELFLKYFPDGKMPREFSFQSNLIDYDSFISSFYKEADKLIG